MQPSRSLLHASLFVLLAPAAFVGAAPDDWAEGASGRSDGATRDYYNRAGLLKWTHYMGDWRDADNVAQGDRPYVTAMVVDDDTPKWLEWDVTDLVRRWIGKEFPNQGAFLRGIKGGGSFHFCSREADDESKRPGLIVTTDAGSVRLSPEADTHLEPSTYRSMGDQATLKVSMQQNHALLRFDLSRFDRSAAIKQATLQLYCFAQYVQSLEIGVFRCSQGHFRSPADPVFGLASAYNQDKGIAGDPNVVFFADFEAPNWKDGWTYVAGYLDPITEDSQREFEPFQGKALRAKIAEGTTTAMNVTYKFEKETGKEPEEIYFRYYLRLGSDWNQTVQGGKMPGISGTYGVAGWGGRRSDGRNGWSARGSFHYSIPKGNPLGGTHPVGTYCYHADMKSNYGDIWLWQIDYRGFLANNRWYCVEQYLKLNTPGEKDGVLRAWIDGHLAFEKTDIRFRLVDSLRIEQVWMNIYHGGTIPSPYDQHAFIDNVVIAKKYIGPMSR